jgi:ferric-dicitrate binding protein FerR (iron transport regulator)
VSLSDQVLAGRILAECLTVHHNHQAALRWRVRLIETLQHPQRRSRRRRWLALGCPVAVAMVFASAGWLWTRQDVIGFSVGPERPPGKLGAYLELPAGTHCELLFTDGSTVELGPSTRARVTKITTQSAAVILETGTARVDVRPLQPDCAKAAGPCTAHVPGTSFDVSFDSETQTLEVVMRSGSIVIDAPGMSTPVQIQGPKRFVYRPGLPGE